MNQIICTGRRDAPTAVNWNSGPQMGGVICPICKTECYNTWGLIEHMNKFHPQRIPEDRVQLLAATWAEAQAVVAEAEAILAGHTPAGGRCSHDQA